MLSYSPPAVLLSCFTGISFPAEKKKVCRSDRLQRISVAEADADQPGLLDDLCFRIDGLELASMPASAPSLDANTRS